MEQVKTNSMDDISKKIQMAHAQCTERFAAGEEDLSAVYGMYDDITSDLEALRGALARIGCPRSQDLVKKLIQGCEGMKAIMEEELAKPR
jgi:hypothetical protein